MCDSEIDVLDIVGEAATGLPDPIKKTFLNVAMRILGGLSSIPRALIERSTQKIIDTTEGRSLVANELANAVANNAVQDPELLQAAAEIYLPDNVRKAKNRIQVAQRAAVQASETTSNGANAAPPDDDWLNLFTRYAEDASSERLQDMFARVLAGEIIHPGSFNLATLRTISELDQQTAQDFSQVWDKSVGDAVDYNPHFRKGEWYSRWQGLAEVGLMASTHSIRFVPERPVIRGELALWHPIYINGSRLSITYHPVAKPKWEHIPFTRVGTQIGSLLAPPDYVTNIRQAGLNLAIQGVSRIELLTENNPAEVLFPSPND